MTKHKKTPRFGRPRLRALLLCTACAFVAMTSTSAAFQNAGRSGSPGALHTVYQVQGSHFNACTGMIPCFSTWLSSTGAVVSRSPATYGAQRIEATYKLYRWNAGWKLQTISTPRTTIGAGYQRVRLPHYSVMPYPAGAGSWSVYITFRWYSANGSFLGSRSVDMNQSGDYACATRFPCTVLTDGIYLGRTVGPLYRSSARARPSEARLPEPAATDPIR